VEKPVKISALKFQSNIDSYDFQFHNSIETIADKWDPLSMSELFLSSDYLKAVEAYPPKGFEFLYCIVERAGQNIGIIYFQIRYLELDKGFQEHNHTKGLYQRFREFSLGMLRHQLAVCGNVLLTGPFGFRFDSSVSNEEANLILNHSFDVLKLEYNKGSEQKLKSILLKDFFSDDQQALAIDSKFSRFEIQPSMYLTLDPEWKSFDDYLGAIKSKYRVRVKRALKKSKGIRCQRLSESEIEQHNTKMFSLFEQTAGKADFSLFNLHPNYFYGLHQYLGDRMNTFGMFDETDELIAFFTIIKHGGKAEAHFLGYDMQANRKHQIYLNMLYEMIKVSIAIKATTLNLSRTALEIKSSIGAKPVMLNLMVNYSGSYINCLMPQLLKVLVPVKEWEPRDPFK